MSLVSGLLVGAMATSAALAPQPAAATRRPTVPAPQHEVGGAGVGDMRRLESAIADWEARSFEASAASRSAPVRGSLIRPAEGDVTGTYGERRRSRRHGGIDFDGSTGDPVFAAGVGTVLHAGPAFTGYSGYGLMVVVDHGDGVHTLYAHLSRISVANGTQVRAGDIVGAIGTTGIVTGSHLHFEVRVGGVTVNPSTWIAGG